MSDRIDDLEEYNEALEEAVVEQRDRLDDLEARVEALNRGRLHNHDQIEELQEENEELRERISKLERVIDTDPEKVSYEGLPRDRKVHRVRSKLVEIASNTNGRHAMDYNDVIALFDGHPSPGHAYKLMDLAGNLDGFNYEKNPNGNDRVTVKTDAVKDLAVFHSANKGNSEEAI